MIKWIKAYFKKRRYKKYMYSREWKLLRSRVLLRDDYKCQFNRCANTKDLQVHHRTYKRFGDERMSDLITYCKHHHLNYIHKKGKR